MRWFTKTLLLSAMATTSWANDEKGGVKVAKLVDGNTQFAFDLYAQLRQQPGNLFLSPYSLSTALAMTYAGARGETAEQMAETLHLSLPPQELHPAFKLIFNTTM